MLESSYQMKVKNGPEAGRKFEVRTDMLVLGSDPGADVVLEGPGVEPRHAQLVFEGGKVKLEDLGTQGGTFRNGQRLLGPVQVFPGDRVGLGPEVVLILEGDDPKAGEHEGGLANSIGQALDDLLGKPGDEKTPNTPEPGKG